MRCPDAIVSTPNFSDPFLLCIDLYQALFLMVWTACKVHHFRLLYKEINYLWKADIGSVFVLLWYFTFKYYTFTSEWIFLKETPNKIIFNSIGKDDFFNTCCSKKICGRALIASGHLIILCKSTKNPGLQFEKIFVGRVKNLSTWLIF